MIVTFNRQIKNTTNEELLYIEQKIIIIDTEEIIYVPTQTIFIVLLIVISEINRTCRENK